MNLEALPTLENKETTIDLTNLSYNFCDDELIKNYYNQKLLGLENKNKWLTENREILLQNKERIAEALKEGLIADDRPETIWQSRVNKTKEGAEKIKKIKKELEKNIDKILEEATIRLKKYLPNWKIDSTFIRFTMNDAADFCVDGNKITVDLGRLLYKKDAAIIENVAQGVIHEIFHIWMQNNQLDFEQNELSSEALKAQIILETIDEGLAVLISNQSLEEHHKKQGRDYNNYVQESFATFRKFLSETKGDELKKIKTLEFKDMGHFYVVGNEIAKTVLQHSGIENFRKIIDECKINPMRLLGEYEEFCRKNTELPKLTI